MSEHHCDHENDGARAEEEIHGDEYKMRLGDRNCKWSLGGRLEMVS